METEFSPAGAPSTYISFTSQANPKPPIMFTTTPDFLIETARQRLSPFLVSVLSRYTGFEGIDSTEYPILVTALISITNSSPTQDQLLDARSQFVIAGFKGKLDQNATIWGMAPVNPWYQHAVAKTASLAPTRLIRREDWGAEETSQALKADAYAMVSKFKRYLESSPTVLDDVCREVGLEGYKLKGDNVQQGGRQREDAQMATHHQIESHGRPIRSQGKTRIGNQPSFREQIEMISGKKRSLDDTGTEEQETQDDAESQHSSTQKPQPAPAALDDSRDRDRPFARETCGNRYTVKSSMRRHWILKHDAITRT
ncbi:hypothetical protein IWZ00DRAFT_546795 [Phyllosticta capitalensis]